MKIQLNDKQYSELIDLVDIFEGCYVENEEVTCFIDIKKIIDEGINLEFLGKSEKEKIRRQLDESFEWLEELNVSTNIINIILASLG